MPKKDDALTGMIISRGYTDLNEYVDQDAASLVSCLFCMLVLLTALTFMFA